MGHLPERAFELLEQIRKTHPMIHHITNSVVTNLTANVTLCLGAAPVMAPCELEVEEMVSFAGALLLNIGTLDPEQVQSMIKAGRMANQLKRPVVLDPVGAGATQLRTNAAKSIMDQVQLTALRGNAGEVFTLIGAGGKVRGVDSQDSIADREALLSAYAKKYGLTLAVTGAVDLVTDGKQTFRVHNGHPLMSQVTGTGCAATTAVAAFLAVAQDSPALTSACALGVFGLAGEMAAAASPGPGSFVPKLLDALAAMDRNACLSGIRIEASV
jgi:hydroxyethylthiazole kinase